MVKPIHMDDLQQLARLRTQLAQRTGMIRKMQQVLADTPKRFSLIVKGDNGNERLIETLDLAETDPVLATRLVMAVHDYAIEKAEEARAVLEDHGIDTVPRESESRAKGVPADIADVLDSWADE